ncbi:hypothetical protein GGR53DRAFT_462136 [Hypoxylon sp. FL1150]|nr:hypothetical protein GGR53DRAFT_462136 [Hypoxylon sp. FL1150]
MTTIVPTLARAGRQGTSRFAIAAKTAQATTTITTQRRSTSWIAWEQPNPALYMPRPTAPKTPNDTTNETQEPAVAATSKPHDTRSVDKTTTTTAVGASGSQEVSVSGKSAPSSMHAGSNHSPSSASQTRSAHTTASSGRGLYPWVLPTTLLRIPEITSTWPTSEASAAAAASETIYYADNHYQEKEEGKGLHAETVYEKFSPDLYKRGGVRDGKDGKEGEGEGEDGESDLQCDTTSSSPHDGKMRALVGSISDIMVAMQALQEDSEATTCVPLTCYWQAIYKYMEGVKSLEEAHAVMKSVEDDAFRVAVEEDVKNKAKGKDMKKWKREV